MSAFSVLFPSFVHGRRDPDPQFERERIALETLGVRWRVANVEALSNGDLAAAGKYLGDPRGETLLYRGWLLRPSEYQALADGIERRGARLFTAPHEYRRALLFPEFFPAIADRSLPAVWIDGSDPARAIEAARGLGPPPYFIKDHGKSAKEIWPRGCVVERERDMAEAIRALREFRGDRFEGGVVIRPFVPLKYLGESPFGGAVHEEFRLFFCRGRLISATAYDRLGGDPNTLDDHRFLAGRIASPFFSADVVTAADGRRFVLECGDGGASALPPSVNPLEFYRALRGAFDAAVDARE